MLTISVILKKLLNFQATNQPSKEAKIECLALWRVLVLIREASLRSADKHTPQKEKQAR